MSEKKKIDTKALLEKSRSAKVKPHSKTLDKKLGKKLKSSGRFHKVNFNG